MKNVFFIHCNKIREYFVRRIVSNACYMFDKNVHDVKKYSAKAV